MKFYFWAVFAASFLAEFDSDQMCTFKQIQFKLNTSETNFSSKKKKKTQIK